MLFNNNGDKVGFTSNNTTDGIEIIPNYPVDKDFKNDKIKEVVTIFDKKYLGGFY